MIVDNHRRFDQYNSSSRTTNRIATRTIATNTTQYKNSNQIEIRASKSQTQLCKRESFSARICTTKLCRPLSAPAYLNSQSSPLQSVEKANVTDKQSTTAKITKVYIHDGGSGPDTEEHKLVESTLSYRGIPTERLTIKNLERNKLKITADAPIIGDHDLMKVVLRRLGIKHGTGDCYPKSIRSFLKRNVWRSTIKILEEGCKFGLQRPIFVKPQTDTKRFTGCVIGSENDFHQLQNASRKTKIYCTEVVEWVSEFRVFVQDSKIVGMKYYAGDNNQVPDRKLIEACIETFEESNESSAGYALDFGVLENGETALVEWNDGFALGAYGLAGSTYTDLLITRWQELVDCGA